jgi:hypothetical protein
MDELYSNNNSAVENIMIGDQNIGKSPSVTLYHGECLETMATLPDQSIDMIMCDLPYG